jgi:hypothetical protein
MFTGFWCGNPSERDTWEEPDVDVMIIVEWIFKT